MTKMMLVVATGLLLSGCILDDRHPIGVGISVGGGPAPMIVSGPPLWAPAYGRRAPVYRYYYYPDADVYYNVVTSSYFYLDGGRWQMGFGLPAWLLINPDAYVSIDLATDRPYLYYHEHRNLYRGWSGGGYGRRYDYGRGYDRGYGRWSGEAHYYGHGEKHGHGHGHNH